MAMVNATDATTAMVCNILRFLSELSSILRMGVKIKLTHFTEIAETVEARI
jgi:hypothetical protein